MCVTRRFKIAASSLTMKHVSQYGRLDQNSQKSVSGRRQQAANSSGDEDALVDVEKDLGPQRAARISPATGATKEEAGGFPGTDPTDPEGRPGDAAQAAAHGQTDLGTATGGWLHGRLYRGEGRGAGADPENPGGVCAAAASPWRGAGGLRPCTGQREWPVA